MIPTDQEIIDCLRTGCRTATDIVVRLHGLDGTGTAREYTEYYYRRNSYNRRLNSLARYGIVKKVGMERYGGCVRMAFEVVE